MSRSYLLPILQVGWSWFNRIVVKRRNTELVAGAKQNVKEEKETRKCDEQTREPTNGASAPDYMGILEQCLVSCRWARTKQ